MREMVFNHASAVCPNVEQYQLVEWLREIVSGMASLVNRQIVANELRMEKTFAEFECMPKYTLLVAIQSMRKYGHRDEYVYLVRLATKSPLINKLEKRLADRFVGCEDRTFIELDGAPLVLCAIADWVAISIPSKPCWDQDRLIVEFDEILATDRIETASENVDQLSRPRHAVTIHERHIDKTRAGTDPRQIWANRETIVPNLKFAPGVQNNLVNCGNVIGTVVGKLSMLDQSTRNWVQDGGPAPRWRTKVSPENNSDMRNRKFRHSRTFRSLAGRQEIFEWHARYGDSGRIHLRFDSNTFEVEIGYIGSHLP